MPIDQKRAEEYSQRILDQFLKDPTKLGPHESRLAEKHWEASRAAKSIDQQVRQINGQIHQAQARVRSLELQYNEKVGKAAAFLEYIIALKFDGDSEATSKEPKKETKSPTRASAQRKKANKKSTKTR